MEVVYHPLVQRDVAEVLAYYHKVSERLANEFHDEVRVMLVRHHERHPRYGLDRE